MNWIEGQWQDDDKSSIGKHTHTRHITRSTPLVNIITDIMFTSIRSCTVYTPAHCAQCTFYNDKKLFTPKRNIPDDITLNSRCVHAYDEVQFHLLVCCCSPLNVKQQLLECIQIEEKNIRKCQKHLFHCHNFTGRNHFCREYIFVSNREQTFTCWENSSLFKRHEFKWEISPLLLVKKVLASHLHLHAPDACS